jgi:chemotaxis signal transduction protein
MSRVISASANGHGPGDGHWADNGHGPAATAEPDTIMTFQIAGQQYGLLIRAVREVVQVPAMVALPGSAAAVCGLLNRHGRYLPVLDGRVLAGAPPHFSLDSQVVLLGGDISELGLLVDQVLGVHSSAAGVTTRLEPGAASPWLMSVWRGDGAPVLVVDWLALRAMAAVLAPEQP